MQILGQAEQGRLSGKDLADYKYRLRHSQIARSAANKEVAQEAKATEAAQESPQVNHDADEMTVILKVRGEEYWIYLATPDFSSAIMASDFNQRHFEKMIISKMTGIGRVTLK